MRERFISIGIIVILAMAAPARAAVDASGLSAADERVRVEASTRLREHKAQAVGSLAALLDGENPTAAKMAHQTLFAIVQRAAGTPDAEAVAAALAGELGRHSVASRRQLCDWLGYLGAQQPALDALAGALGKADLREDARMALTRIAGEASTNVLIGALAQADGAFKVAIIQGLGQKGDVQAVPALVQASAAEDRDVRAAAWPALARLGSPAALDAFTQAVETKQDPAAIAALFDYADHLLAAGRLQEADVVLRLRKQAGPLDQLDTCRMLRAHARLGTPESISLILGSLEDTDPRIRGAAFEAAEILPGTEVTRALTNRMNASKGQTKLDMLRLLGKRGRQMDDRTVMLMYMAMLDKDDAVKIACIQAMQEAQVTSTLPTFLNLVRGPTGPVADAAEQALCRISDPIVTQQILPVLANSTPQGRARLIRVLELRGDAAALPAVTRWADDRDPQVRQAVFRCLGRLGAEDAYEVLLAAFDRPAGPDRDAAEQAMAMLQSDLITARLLSGYFESSDAQKPSLLRVLTGRQLEAIDALLMSEVANPDQDVREAAVLGLCRRAKPAMAGALLEAAKAGPATIAAPALDASLDIARKVEATDKGAAASMFVEVLKLSTVEGQQRRALAGIARTADPATAGLIESIVPLLNDSNVQAEAGSALAALAARLPAAQKDRAVELLTKVAGGVADRGVRGQAIAALRERGVQLDPAREAGLITCWWLIGPVNRHGDRDWDRLPAALSQVDVSRPVTLDDQAWPWQRVHTPSPDGIVDLAAALGDVAGRAAYAYAQINVESAQQAVLKIGSDDGIALWVNGKNVHANNAARPLTLDEDTVEVPLQAGANTIIARIQQGHGQWAFSVRVLTPEGKPTKLQQKLQ